MQLRDEGASVSGEKRSFVGCRFAEEEGGLACMRFSATNGYLHCVSSVDLEGLHAAVGEGDLQRLKVIQGKMKCSSARVSDEILVASCSSGDDLDVLATDKCLGILRGDGALEQLLPVDYLAQMGSPLVLRTARVRKNLLFCMDDTGSIHVVCLLTMLLIDVWSKVELLLMHFLLTNIKLVL
jgi:hypothetical protein